MADDLLFRWLMLCVVVLGHSVRQATAWVNIFQDFFNQEAAGGGRVDAVETEDGDARFGFVQLNSGATSFNTTLNLTGPILLGLGIAAATLFYAYFHAFQGSTKGYNRGKRFAVEPLLSMEDVVLALDSMDDSPIMSDLDDLSLGLLEAEYPYAKYGPKYAKYGPKSHQLSQLKKKEEEDEANLCARLKEECRKWQDNKDNALVLDHKYTQPIISWREAGLAAGGFGSSPLACQALLDRCTTS